MSITAFFFSSGIGKTVKVLIEKGADVNAVNNENTSALILAAWRGKEVDAHDQWIYYS